MTPKQNRYQFFKSHMQYQANIDNRVEMYIIRERNVKNITFQSRFVFNVFLQLLISNWLKLISWGF